MLKRKKKVFIRKSDIKTVVSYNYFEEEIGGFFSSKKIKHYPKFIIFCSLDKSKPYTRWFKTDEELEKALEELMLDLEDKTKDFLVIDTVDVF